MASRKNKWRTRGMLQFRRETKRYSDGTPWGCDVLYVRIKGKACITVEPFDWGQQEPAGKRRLCVHLGTYRAATAVEAAQHGRGYLVARATESDWSNARFKVGGRGRYTRAQAEEKAQAIHAKTGAIVSIERA